MAFPLFFKLGLLLTLVSVLLPVIAHADYTIDYGDGSSEIFSVAPWTAGSKPAIASHSYSVEGIYQLTITAELDCDGDGLADPDQYTDSMTIIVGNVSQQWDYGDNSTRLTSPDSLCANVLTPGTHTYTQAGSYTATYTALGYNNQLITDTVEVIVTAIADHYAISHSGTGLTCEASLITVTAHDANHLDVNVSADTSLTISTTPSVDSIISSPLIIPSGTASATFYLAQSTVSTIDINITDGNSTELTGTASASEDLPIDFSATAFRYIDSVSLTTLNIANQIGGKASSTAPDAQSIGLQAIRTDTQSGACTAAFANQSTAVNFAYECNNPVLCQASGLLNLSASSIYSAGTAIAGNDSGAVNNYTPVTMNFDANGIAPLSFLYDDVGAITLYATKTLAADNTTTPPTSAATLSVSKQFIVRPFGIVMAITGNPAASTTTGSIFRKAGEVFTASAQAVLYQAADDADYDGIPDGFNDTNPGNNTSLSDNAPATNFGNEISPESILLSAVLDQPATGNNPILSGSTTLSSPSWSAADIAYNEVGIIELVANLTDNSYLGIDDSIGKSGYVGRFIPDHYRASIDTIGSYQAMCNSLFTYNGQPMNYLTTPALLISAENAANNTTLNYRDGFVKLDNSSVTIQAPSSDSSNSLSIEVREALLNTVLTNLSNGSLVSNNDGTVTYTLNTTDKLNYIKNSIAQVDPFQTNIDLLTSNIIDSDSITYLGTLPTIEPSAVEIRYGRIVTENVFGSELIALDMPMYVQYYNNGFIVNSDDACSINPSSITYNKQVSTTETVNGSLSIDSDGINFSPPGAGTGYVEVTLDIGLNGDQFFWLQYDWDGDGDFFDTAADASLTGAGNNPPRSRASFGIYKRSKRIIYTRELY